PLVSIFLLRRTPKISGSFISSDETIPHTRKKWVLFRFCLCLFIVVTIIEAVRNLLLSGTALSFYAGVINLGALVLKLGCSAWLLSIFNKHNAAGVSAVYRMAFLLILGVVLCLPFLLEGSWGAHTLLDIGAFFFQLTVIMVAYEISIGFNLSPIIVFGSTRVAWTLGALAGIGIEGLYRAIIGTETIALLSVLLGLAAAIAFVFVFTDKDCVEILSSVPLPVQVPHFKSKCEQLARRSNISDRECEVLILTAKGRSARRIAEDLNVTLATANSHIHHIYQKLGIHSRQELLDLIEIERISH
ncbi:MAG: helix-turn-helix transcriptional regulator, partial [Raoultibacter sp.]